MFRKKDKFILYSCLPGGIAFVLVWDGVFENLMDLEMKYEITVIYG